MDQPILQVYSLGTVAYETALKIQENRRDQVLCGEAGSALYLLQHPPTVTIGSLTGAHDLLVGVEEMRNLGVTVVHTNRGGKATYHGPGQLVGYAVLDLRLFPHVCGSAHDGSGGAPSVRRYLRLIEQTLIDTLAQMGAIARAGDSEAGVWIGNRKIASIGVAVRRWVTSHGFALNVNIDLESFAIIRPCGLNYKAMTSIEHEGLQVPDWGELQALVAYQFGESMGCAMTWESSEYPHLRR